MMSGTIPHVRETATFMAQIENGEPAQYRLLLCELRGGRGYVFLMELARMGFEAKVPKLAALKYHRKIATLLATVRWLEVTATDDALELFDVFMTGELIGRAGCSSDKEKLKRSHGQAGHAGVLSAAIGVLFEAETWGEAVPLAVVWDAMESVVGSRAKLRPLRRPPGTAGGADRSPEGRRPHPPGLGGCPTSTLPWPRCRDRGAQW